jgi:succinoglycan biosynthesis transport protein ExoP
MESSRLLAVLNNRKWLLLLCILSTALLTYVVAGRSGAKWQATVHLVVPQTSSFAVVTGQKTPTDNYVADVGPNAKETAKEQAAILETFTKSPEVIQPALHQLGAASEDRELPKRITLEGESPRLYDLNVIDADPHRAQNLANALATRLVAYNRQINSDQAQKSVALLRSQLQQSDNNLKILQHKYDLLKLQNYVDGDPIKASEALSARLQEIQGKRDDVAGKLAALRGELQIQQAEITATPATVTSPSQGANTVLQDLESALSQSEFKLNGLRARYTEQHPAYIQALTERDDLKRRIAEETARHPSTDQELSSAQQQSNPRIAIIREEASKTSQQIAATNTQLTLIDETITDLNNQSRRYKKINTPLMTLQDAITAEKEGRRSLADRLNSALLALDVAERQNPIEIMDYAGALNPPINTSAGRTAKTVLIAVLCAFLCAAGLFIFIDSRDRRVNTPDEAKGSLPWPILAAIPQPDSGVSFSELARVAALQPGSRQAEAFRFLGMRLLTPSERRIRSVMAVAAKADQGCTTAIVNLAITLARAGERVVLVDANLRNPQIHELFHARNDLGFSDLLEALTPDRLDCALQPTQIANLQVITSGRLEQHPWELLRAGSLHDLAHRLRERADFILFDTPPPLLFTDALSLAPVIDAAVLCVRAQEPLTGREAQLIEMLEQVHVTVLGSVICNVPPTAEAASYAHQDAGPVTDPRNARRLHSPAKADAGRAVAHYELGTAITRLPDEHRLGTAKWEE